MKTFLKFLIFLVLGVIIGTVIGYYFLATKSPVAQCNQKYTYINKTFGCENTRTIKKQEYTHFQTQLLAFIADQIKAHKVNQTSVYFRDLIQGPTFGVGEDDIYIPASLLKLPLLMTYLNVAADDPAILKRRASYSSVDNEVQQEKDLQMEIKPRTLYSVDYLLNHMIIYSDNLAYGLLVKVLEKAYPTQMPYLTTLKELGLVNPEKTTESNITVKSYASLFRQLYNSTYVSPELSEKGLTMLSKSDYKEGLVAGVPNGITVAHKFGDREGLPNGEKQLHDCGIIYYPQNPYVLCIMSRGSDSAQLTNIIKTISSKVYKEVDSRKY